VLSKIILDRYGCPTVLDSDVQVLISKVMHRPHPRYKERLQVYSYANPPTLGYTRVPSLRSRIVVSHPKMENLRAMTANEPLTREGKLSPTRPVESDRQPFLPTFLPRCHRTLAIVRGPPQTGVWRWYLRDSGG